jgi:acyl carrier protein
MACILMRDAALLDTVGELREALKGKPHAGVEPEDLWALGDALSYNVEISFSESHAACFDVTFMAQPKNDLKRLNPVPIFAVQGITDRRKPLGQYANNPLQGLFSQQLVPHLRAYLHERLPDYMIPSAFVMLDSLPLTPNGKVDRRALLPPDIARPSFVHAYIAPESPVEQALAEIWKEVLSVDRISIHDNFFDLGGHSLLGVQLTSRVRKTFNIELSVRQIFEMATIASLARFIEDVLISEVEALTDEETKRRLSET